MVKNWDTRWMAQRELSPYQSNSNGFTLIEMLFVVSLLSIILLLFPSLNMESVEKQQEKQFLETLKFDVLYIQNLSNLATDEKLYIRLYEDNYKIIKGVTKPIAERPYPDGMVIDYRGNPDLYFNENGTFLYPRTIRITTKYSVYDMIFQLGKGRFYIAQR
ncbi:competence type IV pilus minor pilin ComGD [Oceanobacillus saliphilus]|uniref:competence type IV pilus minor pilin ComGD n=1 Tax=Oceanobacillus saliphilus TaxID=2925834 RepID=UPI00201DF8B6|nr:competence type IV pilus minor pilin ComGD [Oceanobacillus saliphilus]